MPAQIDHMNKLTPEQMEALRKEFLQKLGLDKFSLDQLVSLAHQEISELCDGKEWRMSIPAQGDDSDIIISEALREQTREIARLKRELNNVRDQQLSG